MGLLLHVRRHPQPPQRPCHRRSARCSPVRGPSPAILGRAAPWSYPPVHSASGQCLPGRASCPALTTAPGGGKLMTTRAICSRPGGRLGIVRSVLDGDAVFVPDDVPRRGVLALWGTGSGAGKVELVFTRAGGLRKRLVTARFLPVAAAPPGLRSLDPNATGPAGHAPPPTPRGLAAAATAGIWLVARGRLLPTVGPGGTDAWRIGPLDAADLASLRELAARLPPRAHRP